MARARNIKPGFFKNEEIGSLPMGARLLFIGMWTLADRNGRLEDRPARIAGEVFPYDRGLMISEVDGWLTQLAESHECFIKRYSVEGKRFIQITNFEKHQSPHIKEQASTIPAPDMPGASPVQTPDKHQPRQCVAPPDSLNPSSLNPDCLNPSVPVPGKKRATQIPVDSLSEEWAGYPIEKFGWSRERTEATFETMRLWAVSKGSVYVDWLSAWQGWCRRENEKPRAGPALPFQRQSAADGVMALVRSRIEKGESPL